MPTKPEHAMSQTSTSLPSSSPPPPPPSAATSAPAADRPAAIKDIPSKLATLTVKATEPEGPDLTPVVTETRRVNPRALQRREVNARYMEPHTFRRLVQNIKTDGQLTADVLAYLHDDGSLEIISGHHRTEAAVEAELDGIDVRVITSRHTQERLTALQLSHNSIAGKDNPAILEQMYNGLGLDWKKYSGLTDDDVTKFQDLKIDGLGAAGLKYEELVLTFLHEDLVAVDGALKKLETHGKKVTKDGASKDADGEPIAHVRAAHFDDFERFFNAVVRTKMKLNVHNSALAIVMMTELAMERLDQIEAQRKAEEEARAVAEQAKDAAASAAAS
jgi:ParB-like nuclease domain